MSDPDVEAFVYLELDDALEVYGAIIGASAAQAADHLRNRDALAGALARPINYANYENADLALQGAMLAHGIAETQPFIDANKRTALVAMLTFFELNGFTIDATDRELADWIISFSGGVAPAAVADSLRQRLRAIT